MKKSVYTSFLFFLAIVFLLPGPSCRKKYEEDPWTMRFVNLGKRIEGEWSIQKILIDGTDSTSIIYVDSLQIFSTYIFSDYSHSYGWGSLKVKTYNGTYSYSDLAFIFVQSDDLNTISLHVKGNSWEYLTTNKIITAYGPINNFDVNKNYWSILKLTTKEMHLSLNYNAKQYELFFKKV